MPYNQGNNPFNYSTKYDKGKYKSKKEVKKILKAQKEGSTVEVGESTSKVFKRFGKSYVRFFEGEHKGKKFKVDPSSKIKTEEHEKGEKSKSWLYGGDYKVVSSKTKRGRTKRIKTLKSID